MHNFVDALNDISPSVWGIACIMIGATLTITGYAETGRDLVVGGFALVTGHKLTAAQNAQKLDGETK